MERVRKGPRRRKRGGKVVVTPAPQLDEFVKAAGYPGKHDIEAVARLAEEPFLHLVGDSFWCADHREAAIAPGNPSELPHRQIVAPSAIDDTLATAFAGIALWDIGERCIELET